MSVLQHLNGSGAANANVQAVTGLTAFSAGSLIVVAVAASGGALSPTSVVSITDNGGSPNTYVQVPGAYAHTASSSFTDIWYAVNSNAGATSVTVTFSVTSTGEKNVEVWEFTSSVTSSPVDVVGTPIINAALGSTSPSGSAITTLNATDALVAVIIGTTASVTANPHAANAFSAGGDISTQSAAGFISALETSPSTYTPQWDTDVSTGTMFASSASFKTAAAGGGASSPVATESGTLGDAPPLNIKISGGLAVKQPTADINAGLWTPSSGGTLFGMINETTADVSTSDSSSLSPTGDTFEVSLGNAPVAIDLTGMPGVLNYQYSGSVTGGRRVDLTVVLLCNSTPIQTWTLPAIQSAYLIAPLQLSTAGLAAIIPGGALSLRTTATQI